MDDALSSERILAGLETQFLGQNLLYLPETPSTNDHLRGLAQEGAPEGTVVITDYQSAGRGRLGRRWEAPPGECLLLSLLFRPQLAAHQAQRLTMICGLAAVDAIASATGLDVALKWPNDIVAQEGKLGGILTEVSYQADRLDYVIAGVGLNVNLDPAALPDQLLVPATSVAHLVGRRVDRLPLLWTFLRSLEARYLVLRDGVSPQQEWAERLDTLGQPVTVATGDRLIEGLAEGVNADGALLVRQANGRLQTVVAGDVTLRVAAE
jgi:BirA family biotin operon repressor/biotin-[acetyl-CoA-carboxylase] ligase